MKVLVLKKLAELVEDFSLYPRSDVDSTHVGHIVDAIEAGVSLPPIVADEKTLRIVDGFHRRRAYLSARGQGVEIKVELRGYKNDAELFAEAMRLNCAHGRNITTSDRMRCVLVSQKLGLQPERIATILNITKERLDKIINVTVVKVDRKNQVPPPPQPVNLSGVFNSSTMAEQLYNSAISPNRVSPLKMPARHIARQGRTLTKEQADIMPRLGGNQQTFYANQLILLIESGLIDRENENLLERLKVLKKLLADVV